MDTIDGQGDDLDDLILSSGSSFSNFYGISMYLI